MSEKGGMDTGDEVDTKKMGGEYSVGGVIWLKISGGLWWPGQIVGEKDVSEGSKARNKTDGEVRVRVYGSYEYFYVDPAKSSAEFETVLKRYNGSYQKIFEKSLEQSIYSSRSKGQESKSKSKSKEATKVSASKKKGKHNELGSSTPRTKQAKEKVPEQEGLCNSGKRPRLQNSGTEALSGNSESNTRRMRVMKSLGLTAPTGSPFSKSRQTK